MEFSSIFETLYNIIVTIINAVFFFLPDSPVQSWQFGAADYGTWIGWLNWFVPIHEISVFLGVWGIAVGLFYVVQVALRWAKADD